MAQEISPTLLAEFSAALAARTGLYFSALRQRDLLQGLERAAAEFGFSGAGAAQACMRWLLIQRPTRRQAEILASHLAVGETYFFREPATFTVLERQILPALIAARRSAGKRLRIWSAGCCTGEETYSLAILLARLIPDLEDWSISLLGTDINPDFLVRAVEGSYREWSFRGVPASIRKAYFKDTGTGKYAPLPRVKQLARFEFLNLMDDVYPCFDNDPATTDIVMCRHVLMYFDVATARAVVQRLRRALTDGGWLIVSQTETSAGLFSGFMPVSFPDSVVYQKECAGQALRTDPFWGTDGDAVAQPSLSAAWWPGLGMKGDAVDAAKTVSQGAATEPLLAVGREAPKPACDPNALTQDDHGKDEPVSDARFVGGEGPQDLAMLARACANAGRLDAARRWCEAAVSADKLNPELRYLLASILLEQGHAEQAAPLLKQVLYLDQNFVLAHFALGNVYRRDGHAEQARQHFAIAARLLRTCAPDSSLPHSDGLSAARLLKIIQTLEPVS